MSHVVRIATLYPEQLDLNGDQGNALVLLKQLEWAGIPAELVKLDMSLDVWPSNIDFLLIGHGSRAAWQHVEADLKSRIVWLKTAIASGVPGLAVGSGQEIFYPVSDSNNLGLGLIYRELEDQERISRFVIADLSGVEVLGYLNRSSDAPMIERLGSMVLTGLHGPVLAKNETLLQQLLAEISTRRLLELNLSLPSAKRDRASSAVAQVWELEEGLARE